jgi:hypothetical protein
LHRWLLKVKLNFLSVMVSEHMLQNLKFRLLGYLYCVKVKGDVEANYK